MQSHFLFIPNSLEISTFSIYLYTFCEQKSCVKTGKLLDRFIEEKTPIDRFGKAKSPQMFNRISGRYDFLNHFLSLGQDIRWRSKAVEQFRERPDQTVLDAASGTADLILAAVKKNRMITCGIGIDPAVNMLQIGRRKIEKRGLAERIKLLPADGQQLPFAGNSFDGVMIAFGIRNFSDFHQGLMEFYRILRKDGRLVVLEFSLPVNPIIRTGYLFYFRKVLPGLGGLFSGDKTAYRYLNETVESFVYGDEFCQKLREAGFQSVKMIRLTFGIVTIYIGDKS